MAQSLKVVFCGTPRFALFTLEKLVKAGFPVQLVVTQPDRRQGRGLELVRSPIKQSAQQLGLPITQPDKIKKNDEFRAQLATLEPDVIVVVGYGRIIPHWMLDLPPLGNINLHASLLPKYRGAAPIQWAIAQGETVTGVTTMRIDAGLDTGDILLQREIRITDADTAETLTPRLAQLGADLMVETLRGLQSDSIEPRPQDSSVATLAPILKKEDGLLDFSRPSFELLNRIRGFQPWPGAYTKFRGKNLHVWKAASASEALPIAEFDLMREHLMVGCGHNTSLELLEVQLEGKKRSPARDFVHGYRPLPGEKLGT
jgi:methionyl-tRNA formyltransferase